MAPNLFTLIWFILSLFVFVMMFVRGTFSEFLLSLQIVLALIIVLTTENELSKIKVNIKQKKKKSKGGKK